MAFDVTKLRMIQEMGFTNLGARTSTGVARGASVYAYESSDAATDIVATGYFAKCGYGSNNKSSDASYAVGMRYGDLLLNRESSAGASPGRVSWHSVIGTTANQASTSASTGWNTAYDVSVSAHAST